MEQLFRYNWAIRDEWFQLCSEIPYIELIKDRSGGVGSILKTLFHIVDVECSWLQAIQGKPVSEPDYEDFGSLVLVKQLSDSYRHENSPFIEKWSSELEYEIVTPPWDNEAFYYGEVLRHVVAHEIHHIGQLSVWTREMGLKPVEANFIGRGLMNK